jgi:hypothetical protein
VLLAPDSFYYILQDILDVVQVVAREIVAVISVVPRLRTLPGVLIDPKTGAKLHAPSASSATTTSSDKTQMKPHIQTHSSAAKGDAKLQAPTSSSSSSQKSLPSFYEVQALNIFVLSSLSYLYCILTELRSCTLFCPVVHP